MTYFNTTQETEQLDLFIKINEGQDRNVLKIVTEMKTFSASRVWQKYIHLYFKSATPLTSVRRSLNTLLKGGYIGKTGDRVKGIYGRSELEYTIL